MTSELFTALWHCDMFVYKKVVLCCSPCGPPFSWVMVNCGETLKFSSYFYAMKYFNGSGARSGTKNNGLLNVMQDCSHCTRAWNGTRPIVSYCASPVPCTCPVPVRVQCERAIGTFENVFSVTLPSQGGQDPIMISPHGQGLSPNQGAMVCKYKPSCCLTSCILTFIRECMLLTVCFELETWNFLILFRWHLFVTNLGSGQYDGFRSHRLDGRELPDDDELVSVHGRKPHQQVTVREAGAAGQYSEPKNASDIAE